MVSPSSKRRAAEASVEKGCAGVSAACRALGLARSTYYRKSEESAEKRESREQIVALSLEHPRYGYRRVTVILGRRGKKVNAKRVQRVRRAEGLVVSKRQRKMRRVGVSTGQRQKAERPRQVWSWDFVHDQTEDGSSLRILTLIDEHTRQCVAMHVARSIRAVDVITVVEAAIARYGAPEYLRSDNGPEFIAYAVQDWLKASGIKTMYIKPGAPWENGYIERAEARVIVESWRVEYNERRPHSALGYLTPKEYTNQVAGGCAPPNPAPLTAAGVRGEPEALPRQCGTTKSRNKKQPRGTLV
ncbi:MAG: IS3 family transposase [Verrucomicrobia bacterium]|nr:IS3 family transposase [Verrucomicrobiota bacterium]